MLHNITIENFFSIAEPQTLDFSAPHNAPDLDCFKPSLADPTIRLPTAIGLFGANASGKSTVLRAFVSSVMFMIFSFDWTNQVAIHFQPYRQKKWLKKPTKILIEFDCQLTDETPLTLFQYELHIEHETEDCNQKTVSYEALSYAPKGKFRNLFERKKQQFDFSQEFGISNAKNDPRKSSIRPNASVISTLIKLNHNLSNHVAQYLMKIETNKISFMPIHREWNKLLSIYANDKKCLEKLNKELRRLDIGLESMSVEIDSQGQLYAKFKHIGLDNDIHFAEESAGTQHFIENFPRLHYALETGTIVFLDEIDNAIHPHIIPELLRWFSDDKRNPHKAQLFFTAHNPTILDELEKEQVFFTEKRSGKPSCVYSARNIKGLRREPSLMKKYLAGELGAIPYIG